METVTQRMNAESLAEILSEYGIEATPQQCMSVASDFAEHLSMMREMQSYGHDRPSKPGKDPIIAELEKENAILRIELGNRVGSHLLEIYHGSLKVNYDPSFERKETRFV